jgi:hypothetical protein
MVRSIPVMRNAPPSRKTSHRCAEGLPWRIKLASSRIGGHPPSQEGRHRRGGQRAKRPTPNAIFSQVLAPTPQAQKLPIAPIFIADKVSLAISRERDGKLRLVYGGWDNANVVQPDGCGQARGQWEADLTPLPRALTPPLKN